MRGFFGKTGTGDTQGSHNSRKNKRAPTRNITQNPKVLYRCDAHVYVCMHVSACPYIYTYECECIYVCVFTYIYIYICKLVCKLGVCVCARYVCMWPYTVRITS